MFSRYGNGKTSGGVGSGKMFLGVSNTQTNKKGSKIYVPGAGVGASSVFARRAKNMRATPILPLAPIILGVLYIDNTSVILNILQGSNGTSNVINYKYSLNGGTSFINLSPANATSAIKIENLTKKNTYKIILQAINGRGDSESSNEITITTLDLPSPPILDPIIVSNTNTTIDVSFTQIPNGSSPIINYMYSINGGSSFINLSPEDGITPITIKGLRSGTTYNVQLRAINLSGFGPVSNTISVSTKMTPFEPTNLYVSSKTTTTIDISFAQIPNGTSPITNYKYSIDGGLSFTPLSPSDLVSPITITGLTENTTYNIQLKAVNTVGDSEPSNTITEKTYLTNYAVFTTVGASTWTAPAGVKQVEYLVVGGGGGGGATYSNVQRISNVGNTDITASSTVLSNTYWFDSSTVRGTSGLLYYGNTVQTYNEPICATIGNSTWSPPGSWYHSWSSSYDNVVYWDVSYGYPKITNIAFMNASGSDITPSLILRDSINTSAGSGGGGGGSILSTAIYPYPICNVTPGTTYNIYVGDGGTGGIGDIGSETSGNNGEASYFGNIIASGGVGGKPSRTGFNTNGGGGQYIDYNYKVNNFYTSNIIGGRGGSSGDINGRNLIQNSEIYVYPERKKTFGITPAQLPYISRGTYGGSGELINFGHSGTTVEYGRGGDGGNPNTANVVSTPANTGQGGKGTGATLNSYNSGNKGGSGIVVLKYYT